MCKDTFGGLFDFDMDGETDSFELALGLNEVWKDEAHSERAMRFDDEDGETDEVDDALSSAGLNHFDLELMDDAERREALEDAGLDPDDYI